MLNKSSLQMTPESIEDTSKLVWKASSFFSDATQIFHFLHLLQEDTKGIADKDPDLILDVKSRGSPYGLQHCTRLVGFADPGDGVHLWRLYFPCTRPLVSCC